MLSKDEIKLDSFSVLYVQSMISVYVSIIVILLQLLCVCHIYGDKARWHRILRKPYDYVIVGGGTAGCVVATRLSENPNVTVLLLEAGPDDSKDPFVAIPRLYYVPLKDYDWGFMSEPQKFTADKSKVNLYQAKILGGSSSHNGMNIIRGSSHDFDNWQKMGNKGWSYDDVLPYFKKSEDMMNASLQQNGYHGEGGPMQVKMNYRDPIIGEFITAGEELGFAEIDQNGPDQNGIGLMQNNVNKAGRRHHPPEAFLRPVLARRNLDIVTDAYVTRIIIQKYAKGVSKIKSRSDCKGKAVAVTVMKDDKEWLINVKREVILSAGALNSPRILMLSRVGPERDLAKLGIPAIVDLPVGQGLQDHYHVPLEVTLPKHPTFEFAKVNTFESLFEYIFQGTGPWAAYASVCSAFLHATSQLPDEKFRYLQVLMVNNIGYMDDDIVEAIKRGKSITNQMYAKMKFRDKIQQERFRTLYMGVLHRHPRTSGKVELKSKNPFQLPKITMDILKDPRDVADLIEGIRFTKKWLNVTMLRSRGVDADIAKGYCKGIEYNTDGYWACYIKKFVSLFSHFSCTCKMAPDKTGVVDHRLRVKGIDNLRVVDASVMPKVVSGYLMAPVIMIAEKASDMIKDDMEDINSNGIH